MTDRIGQVFGNYRLTHLLGQGGFADVYLGEHVHLNTWAAIKVLRTQLTSSDVLDFRNEARTIAHLEHPHIVHVLDFGVEGYTPFLVMAYAPGGTLRQRHPRGSRLPAERIVLYVKQVAAALQYAHQQRLIHRDIKPENMLLGRNNEVLLSDFGIALLTPSARTQNLLERSGTSEMAGTVPYMAPEQIQGRPSPASDQYALGVVVYEWLCGVLPFNGPYMEIALQHVSALPPLLREKDPTIPADVEKVVLTALAKEPALRFGSVQAFATALEQAYQPELSRVIGSGPIPPHYSSTDPTEKATLEAVLQGPFGRLALGSSPVRIGRTSANQLVIDDLKVSSQHAEIRPTGQGHRILDLNSTNGTFVNEQCLASGASRPLNQGDTIRVGDTKFSYAQSSAVPGVMTDDPTQQANPRLGQRVAPALTPALPPFHTGYGSGRPPAGQLNGLHAAGPGTRPPAQPHEPSHTGIPAGPAERSSAPSNSPSRPNRRVLWLALSLVAVLLIVAGSAVGVLAYVNALPTPAKALDTFCAALQNKDYQAAYDQLSSRFQNKVPEPLLASFFANVSSCTHSAVSQAGNAATAALTTTALGRATSDHVILVQDSSNAWKIDDDATLSALTKTLATYCTALQRGDYPTAYSQFSGPLQSKISESQLANFFPGVASCTYGSLTMSAQKATATVTTTTASGQTENNAVSLVQDSSNNWKIDDMMNLPDKTLDTFCTALQNKDYQEAYNQLSVAFQGSYPESQFAKDYSQVTGCTHDSATMSNGIVITNVTFSFTSGQPTQYRVSLVRDNTGNWKIDTLEYPPEVPLDTFCKALQSQDYQTAYNQTSDAFQNAVPESQFAQDLSGVTSCTHDFPTMTGTIATATVTLGGSSGQTVKFKVTLIQDKNADWKIDSFQKA